MFFCFLTKLIERLTKSHSLKILLLLLFCFDDFSRCFVERSLKKLIDFDSCLVERKIFIADSTSRRSVENLLSNRSRRNFGSFIVQASAERWFCRSCRDRRANSSSEIFRIFFCSRWIWTFSRSGLRHKTPSCRWISTSSWTFIRMCSFHSEFSQSKLTMKFPN